MPKVLKFHTRSHKWPNRTLCGKEVEGTTGSPLNSDGSVAESRVDSAEVDCKICLKAAAEEVNEE